MNSKERVRAAIHFNRPDKVPVFNIVSGDVAPLPLIHPKDWNPGFVENEFGLFPHNKNPSSWKKPDWVNNRPEFEETNWKRIPHEEVDEWGIIWSMKGNDRDMGHPGRPSLPDLDKLDDHMKQYDLDASNRGRYKAALNLKKMLSDEQYNMVIFESFGPSHVVSALRGFSNYLMDHVRNPQELKKLLNYVADYHVDAIKMAFKYGLKPDGFWLADDLGEQNGPFFNPRIFRKFYEPIYKRIADAAHELGADLHLHCCGKVDRLIPVLIDCGLDSIEFDSPRMSGYNELKQYRGKIMFWGCVNIQSIYTHGTPEEVEREVWHMIRNLGTKDGGFGAFFYPQPKVIRVSRKNIKAFGKGLEKYGIYSNIPSKWWSYPIIENWKDSEVPPLPN